MLTTFICRNAGRAHKNSDKTFFPRPFFAGLPKFLRCLSVENSSLYRKACYMKTTFSWDAFHFSFLFTSTFVLQTDTLQRITPEIQEPVEDIFEDDDWEDQADKLYEWTQNLSLDELGDTSPWKP